MGAKFAVFSPCLLSAWRITHAPDKMPYVSNGQLDAAILAAMGYRQQLARGFRNWAMSGALTFLAIGTVPYMGLDLVVTKGGPLTALYSWIATVIFSFLTVCSLGEIVSSFPNAGAMVRGEERDTNPMHRIAPLLASRSTTGWGSSCPPSGPLS